MTRRASNGTLASTFKLNLILLRHPEQILTNFCLYWNLGFIFGNERKMDHRSILGYIIVTVKPNLLIVNVLIKCSRNTSSQGCVFQETFLSKCKTMVRPCVKEISSLKWISRNCEPSCQYWNTPPPTGAHKRRSWQTHGFVVIMNYFQHKLEKQTKERELCSECVVVYLKLSLYTLATY